MFIKIVSIIIISIFFFQFININIANKLRLFDIPNSKRKIHKHKVPLTGGIFFILIILLQYVVDYLSNEITLFSGLYLTLFFISIFITGYVDDKINTKALLRVLTTFIILIIFISLEKSYQLIEIKLFFDNINFYKKTNTVYLTSISVLILIILYNMIDGLDGLAISVFICWYLYMFFFYNFDLENGILIFTASLVFFYYNIKKKTFLGSSGNMILALFISLESIQLYNTNNNLDFLQVLLFFFIPFLDLFRLFILRISESKNPLTGDKNHFHHFIYNTSKKNYLIIYIACLMLPCLFFNIFNINIIICFFISFVIYLTLIKYFRKIKSL